jgi:hypothetical protein
VGQAARMARWDEHNSLRHQQRSQADVFHSMPLTLTFLDPPKMVFENKVILTQRKDTSFDVLKDVSIQMLSFQVVTPCSLVDVYRHVGEKCQLHFQFKSVPFLYCIRSSALLSDVCPEDRGSKFLRNVSEHLPDHTASHFSGQ